MTTIVEARSVLRDLRAHPPWAAQVCEWLASAVCAPFASPGRAGALCPYVPSALKYDALTLSLLEPDCTRDEIEQAVRSTRDRLIRIPRDDVRRPRAAHLLVAPPSTTIGATLIDVRRAIKPELLTSGMTCGEFYPTSADTSIRDDELYVARSPWPLLAVRFTSTHDELFLLDQPELLAAFRSSGPGFD